MASSVGGLHGPERDVRFRRQLDVDGVSATYLAPYVHEAHHAGTAGTLASGIALGPV